LCLFVLFMAYRQLLTGTGRRFSKQTYALKKKEIMTKSGEGQVHPPLFVCLPEHFEKVFFWKFISLVVQLFLGYFCFEINRKNFDVIEIKTWFSNAESALLINSSGKKIRVIMIIFAQNSSTLKLMSKPPLMTFTHQLIVF